jgi:hypothetical protein
MHAVYANCISRKGDRLTFRVGQPTDWDTAQRRWSRLDDRRAGFNGVAARAILVPWMRRQYRVESFEVRTVDRNGRGLGSLRHGQAFPIPYRLVRSHA